MKIHHQKHHNAYVTNLNAALDKYSSAVARNDIAEQISLQGAIRFNGTFGSKSLRRKLVLTEVLGKVADTSTTASSGPTWLPRRKEADNLPLDLSPRPLTRVCKQ